ncbi:hypothetical protein [Vibrio parahaemolyticus]|uniref:DUF4231 domain-containing protein n=1 Tax=Vibrio parahaemolyticus TaxID=670 RepID=A0AAW3IUC3_VIBPH|nr:hypothetical protein [Vibrio parahaemolyticus]EHH2455248.1 hypothetical protein [Vibrio parahaemolyticus]KOY31436.1 hypothetical protein ACX05_14670 [Vibrio parahaemolyticus]KOY39831.1 hypothetical protein ACX10_06940 [Vibrio parahaemolyticus]
MAEGKNELVQATEAVKSIPDFISAITDVLQTPSGLIVSVIVLLWFILNRDLTKIYGVFEYKQNKRLSRLDEYINNADSADGETLRVAKEQRDTYYFKIATNGIYAESTLRNSLIRLNENSSSKINWTLIRRAMPYIRLNEQKNIYIRDFDWQDSVSIFYNYTIAIMLGLFSIGSLFLLIFSSSLTFLTTLKIVFVAIMFAIGALVMLAQNLSHTSAKAIKSELKQLDQEKDISTNS